MTHCCLLPRIDRQTLATGALSAARGRLFLSHRRKRRHVVRLLNAKPAHIYLYSGAQPTARLSVICTL